MHLGFQPTRGTVCALKRRDRTNAKTETKQSSSNNVYAPMHKSEKDSLTLILQRHHRNLNL
uniref:Uncharacterized protein n=1 Tax=Rhizophora mucronata TaxID=61149 RepID=A0A2P2NGC6_RHIMU